jgi:hypothetical protein
MNPRKTAIALVRDAIDQAGLDRGKEHGFRRKNSDTLRGKA